MTRRGLQALANAVKEQRQSLGLGQGDLSSRGGPSIVTVGQIERLQIDKPQSSTLKRLDASLGWLEGTAAAILAGRPRPVEEDAGDTPGVIVAIQRDEHLLPEAREHLTKQYRLLLRISEEPGTKTSAATEAEADILELPHAARKRPAPRKRQT